MSTETKKKWIKTLKFLAAYLVAAWTFLQFIDWILNRYNVSPHWVDILLWFFQLHFLLRGWRKMS